MQAIRVHEFGLPEIMRLEEVPDLTPGPGQVVVRVHAAGVNPVEAYVRAGVYPRLPQLPYTPGADAGGTIIAVGDGVRDLAVGDWVYVFGSLTGTYAEQALCDQARVRRLPAPLSFAEGAAIGIPYGTAFRALFHRGRARAGETVLIHGASGAVGIAAIQLAREAGLTVIGTASDEQGKQLVREQGAHHVLDHEAANDPEQIKALTNGHGIDLTLEMLANVNLGKDLGVMARNGCIVIVGNRGKVEIDPRLTMTNELDIRGMTLNNATPEELATTHDVLAVGFEKKTLRPIVSQEFPLAEAARAHHAILESSSYGKLVLVPRT
jgi:NADPH2:quinone reductase